MIGARSSPVGRVPNAPPQSRSSRRRAERVGDGGRCVPDQQRALEDQGHLLDDPAGAELDVVEGRELLLQPRHRLVEPGVGTRREPDLREERVEGVRLPGDGPQRVERSDVARALPDRQQRQLAVDPRQRRSPRCSRCHRGTPAPPRRGSVRACRRSTWSRPARAGVRRPRPRRRGSPGRWRRPAASSRSSPPRTRSRGRRARCASPAARSASCRTPAVAGVVGGQHQRGAHAGRRCRSRSRAGSC